MATKSGDSRRTLRFDSLEELLEDAAQVAQSDRAGTLRRTGNWSAGTTFNHLAAFMSFPFDGWPKQLRAPWIIRVLVRRRRAKYCFGTMPAGIRIPGIKGGTVAMDSCGLDEGLARLRAAASRLKASAPPLESPLFGPLTHEEWIGLNLRHAELHLSFLHPS